MLAIFSNSFDATTDLIVKHLQGRFEIFRFNSDLMPDYSIAWQPGYWEITNLVTSDRVSSNSLSTAYWRKPLEMLSGSIPGYPESYYCAEIRYAFREIINSISRSGKFRLVEPFAERRAGKFYQLDVASRYFSIPQALFALNLPENQINESFQSRATIAKSLSGAEVSNQNVLYTSKIELDLIDRGKPWYLQGLVDADQDVTCAFVAGSCFWASRPRANMRNCLDVRETQEINDWEVYHPNPQQQSKVLGLMQDLCLDFGRLDFLERDGNLIFLEVNPNGQYAWLDIDDKQGLISRIIDEITKAQIVPPA